MILITGGLGFIGTHTTRALLDLGESCLLLQRRAPRDPFPGEGVVVEQADLADEAALLALGDKHDITGILHLAGSFPWPPGADEPVVGARKALTGLLNVFAAAAAWGVTRLGLASTIGIYGGAAGPSPFTEDTPLPLTAPHPIPGFKKISEVLADHLAGAAGLPVVNYRIGAIWGPLGHSPSPFFAAPQLVHAAARGTAVQVHPARAANPPRAGEAIDLCYVKDCGRALALLQTAGTLRHRTYNVASGRPTTNGEVAAVLGELVPDARLDLPEGRGPGVRDTWLDITRLREDTGYEPAYDTERAAAEYLAWLREGHDR
ncbi:NAD(P)-dependent oxidoreductase [Actinomadura sp. ATCC 31491]|uniref:NAD(P)-dependent oxidoreductase n=1 Tax=Actinomadura luzonensis TaxID=2805427 RepID=A0ABT0FVV0_9ACTN|nr:NAD(P)-dependent oxidoreductase [Actinomadura luzonensis]MCK2216459.1 NAD(P)-dependent oxidoreductase [Actinomadura luzonensis]